MKSTILSFLSLSLLLTHPLCAESRPEKPPAATNWLKESELPEGFPNPGPYDQVVQKSYPVYRAATTKTSGPNTGFWTLFRHIKKNNIAMTTPVEMKMSEDPEGALEMSQMSFLYQKPDLGQVGPDGNRVQVTDLPEMKVLSFAWRGHRSKAKVANAKSALLAAAQKKNLTGTSFRLLGYNSPSVPRANRTHELQLILK